MCGEPLNSPGLNCANGHRYSGDGGVIRLIRPDLAQEIENLDAALREFRAAGGVKPISPAAYEQLPGGQEGLEWRLRRYDLDLIRRLLPERGRLSILDVGAWNGWLSNRLAGWGHDVTAVDYFASEQNGLGAIRFYGRTWRAIQLDLADLTILGRRYDVVILNRCLAFFPDPIRYIRLARTMVNPDGRLIVTGLQFFGDASRRRRNIEAQRQAFRRQFGRDLFLRPSPGLLEMDHMQKLAAAGLTLRPYRALWLANLKARLRSVAPRHYYGLAQAKYHE
jgi:SAM-dependent methyltransferase